MTDRIRIPARFNGPPDSANGGYTCGLVAEAVASEAARVSLRRPPPLDVPLERTRHEDGSVVLADGAQVIAHGEPAALTVAPPEPPPLTEATAASDRAGAHLEHPFPTCFVCGPARPARDGLGIFPGPVSGRDLVVAPWRPSGDLATDGIVDRRVIWAALDCPSGWASPAERPAVLAALTARVLHDVPADATYVVTAWPLARDGRKRTAGSALHTADGTLVAFAAALWIELREPAH